MKKSICVRSMSVLTLVLAGAFTGCNGGSSASTTATSALSASSISGFTLSANGATCVLPSGSIQLVASGGSGNYSYSVQASSSGTVSSSGIFYAPSSSVGEVYIVAYDNSTSATTSFYINVTSSCSASTGGSSTTNILAVIPSNSAVVEGGQVTMTTSGGSGVYTYTVTSPSSNGGSFVGNIYTAPTNFIGLVTVLATDSNGLTGSVNLQVLAASGSSTSSPSAKVIAASSNSVLNSSAQPSNLLTNTLNYCLNNPSRYYSSNQQPWIAGNILPSVTLTFGDATTGAAGTFSVDHINLVPRYINNNYFGETAYAFPSDFSVMIPSGNGWASIGDFSGMTPDSTGVVRVQFSQAYDVSQIMIVANTVGYDPNGNPFFQLCAVSE